MKFQTERIKKRESIYLIKKVICDRDKSQTGLNRIARI